MLLERDRARGIGARARVVPRAPRGVRQTRHAASARSYPACPSVAEFTPAARAALLEPAARRELASLPGDLMLAAAFDGSVQYTRREAA